MPRRRPLVVVVEPPNTGEPTMFPVLATPVIHYL